QMPESSGRARSGLAVVSLIRENDVNRIPQDGHSLLDAPIENMAFRLSTELLPECVITGELVDGRGESDLISLREHEARRSVNDEPAGHRTHSSGGHDRAASIHRLVDDQAPRLFEARSRDGRQDEEVACIEVSREVCVLDVSSETDAVLDSETLGKAPDLGLE